MTVQELNAIFGKNIRKYRKSRKWSQELLAEKVDLSINTISETETGKKFIRAETLIGFATIFEVEVYELLKPEGVLPDKPVNILAEFSEEVRQKVDEIGNSYIERMKNEDIGRKTP